ncbi:hypothetical protein B0H17DRAFT_1330703 [Mycena rosella]|uniref:Uncharacterized protein n=1 Tax=Mycena rosella TaxID=1033263 RepID=A0AAD7GIP4_MYCRO|nr:hypothetical protein B0H17DRAFT_1330703 [Mycena rosella]
MTMATSTHMRPSAAKIPAQQQQYCPATRGLLRAHGWRGCTVWTGSTKRPADPPPIHNRIRPHPHPPRPTSSKDTRPATRRLPRARAASFQASRQDVNRGLRARGSEGACIVSHRKGGAAQTRTRSGAGKERKHGETRPPHFGRAIPPLPRVLRVPSVVVPQLAWLRIGRILCASVSSSTMPESCGVTPTRTETPLASRSTAPRTPHPEQTVARSVRLAYPAQTRVRRNRSSGANARPRTNAARLLHTHRTQSNK